MAATTRMTSGGWLTQLKSSLWGTVRRMGVCCSPLWASSGPLPRVAESESLVVIPKSPYPAPDVNTEKPSIHSSTKTVLEHQPGQRGRKPGKKRGRTPKPLIPHPISTPSKSAEPLKFPKKRGPKPGSKRKPRTLLNPPPTSPTTSTPEPDTSTVPQDAATIPSSAMQAPTGETFVLGNSLARSLEPHSDSMDSTLNPTNLVSTSQNLRAPGYRPLLPSCGLPLSTASAVRRLCSRGSDRYLESRDASRPSGRDPSSWTVEDVMQFIREADPQLGPHADLFRKHEIDGKALLLLRSDVMMKYMGLKLGPALKLSYHIDRLKQGKF
ncbi:Scm polycomb group protein-like protein 1 [Rhinolophus ferrumequinum]|uniref:Scm polycomb group protein-like protein 1 n=1 Tax=Rhinolophus ferrumequinum TaxID=59479 RepID=A0A7J7X7E8_RHIFE|nr:Scm polycomb group protein-like protein 1 [Rhinolophus ferrumequinum]